MTCSGSAGLTIIRGQTFRYVLRWESKPFVYKAISSISKAAPMRVGSTAHGLPDGWRCAVVSAQGMKEANSTTSRDEDGDFAPDVMLKATVIDANIVDFNGVNSAEYRTYTGGGYLQYYTPHDLTDYTARMQIKDRVGGEVLLELTTEDGTILIDEEEHTITLLLDAEVTAAIEWEDGVTDLELVSPADEVDKLLVLEPVRVEQEVTTEA